MPFVLIKLLWQGANRRLIDSAPVTQRSDAAACAAQLSLQAGCKSLANLIDLRSVRQTACGLYRNWKPLPPLERVYEPRAKEIE